jgi:hypothetical protein
MMGNSIGPWGGTISADYAGGSLYGDRTTAQLFSTFDVAREQVFRISHTRKLNAEGLGISASLLLAQAEPSTFLPSNPASEVLIGRFDVSRPLITRGGFNLSGQVGSALPRHPRSFARSDGAAFRSLAGRYSPGRQLR